MAHPDPPTHYHVLALTAPSAVEIGGRCDTYTEAQGWAQDMTAGARTVWIAAARNDACPTWGLGDDACDGSRFDKDRETDWLHCAQLAAPYWELP